MRRVILIVTASLFVFMGNHSANAGWKEAWARFKLDFHRNNEWPEPFQTTDRHIAVAPWAIQESKGWQLETTLADYHFDRETHELTYAGELKVRWIIKEAPPQRRTVFVVRSHNTEATSIRVDSVQRAIARILPQGPLPEVVQTDTTPRGVPAEYIYDVNTRAAEARPAPVLPTAAASGSE